MWNTHWVIWVMNKKTGLEHVTIRLDIGHYLPIGDPLEQSLYLQPFSILASKSIGVKTLTFQSHVTSSVTWPFDSQGAISYRHSIFTKSLFPAVSQIIGIKHIGGHDLDISGSQDVIGHVTIWFPGSHFLWALHCHQVAISIHFRDNGHQTYRSHDLDISGSRDHSIPRGPFPIGTPLSPSRYLQPFSR